MTRGTNQGAKDQITLRVDREVGERLRRLARAQRTSVSRAAGALLADAVGAPGGPTSGRDVVGDALDAFIGTWSDADAREVRERLVDFESIDTDLWSPPKKKTRGR